MPRTNTIFIYPFLLLLLLTFLFFIPTSSAPSQNQTSINAVNQTQTCNDYRFPDKFSFTTCQDLPVLNSFIHWTYDPSSNTVDLAFRKVHTQSDRWIAWAINPSSTGMIGSQAFVAFQHTDGSMKAYTSPITSYGTMLQEGNLSFPVSRVSSVMLSNNSEMIIFTKFSLPTNNTEVNHLWQEGHMRGGNIPGAHSMTGDSLKSFATVDFSSGKTVPTTTKGTGSSISRNEWKRIHGALNAVSWGTLMPLGMIFARYLKLFPSTGPAWFYLHVACQVSGSLVGIAGGMIGGFVFGMHPTGAKRTAHGYMGMALLALVTLQIILGLIRPNKDHKLRFHWKICHLSIGYFTIALGVFNVFLGLKVLDEGRWTTVYEAVFSALLTMVVLLEIFKWAIFVVQHMRSKKTSINGSKAAADGGVSAAIDQVV